jgi:lipopolysaccharide transport system ATP-binding protein
MLNGLIKPDTGRIEMRGQVGALIALGAGFNPVLSGRENILTNASLLGLGKIETDQKLEEIIDFSEISEFIDSPVQTYSSGMQVRLGFAVATALNPDILILDEVLAVGDARFRSKCWKRLGELSKNTATILVSHEAYAISRLADHALLMKRGMSNGVQHASQALFDYQSSNEETIDLEPIHELADPIKAFEVGSLTTTIKYGCGYVFSLKLNASSPVQIDHGVVNIHNESDLIVAQSVLGELPAITSGLSSLELEIKDLYLPSGNYSLMMMLSGAGGKIPLIHSKHELHFKMSSLISNGPSFYPPISIAVGASK